MAKYSRDTVGQSSSTCKTSEKALKRQLKNDPETQTNDNFKVKKSKKQIGSGKKQKTTIQEDRQPLSKIPTYDVVESAPRQLSGTALAFLQLELEMIKELQSWPISEPVHTVYNPVGYALDPHCNFLQRYCDGKKKFLFLGMNPGPFGMAQTGVPFGEISVVRDWLKVTGEVQKPADEHPKRHVLGFQCKRTEVSGSRFWGYFRKRCTTPDRFFAHCFVYNMCPLVFMTSTGKNLTPPDLRLKQRKPLNDTCARYLCRVLELLQVEVIIGIGNFARDQAKEALSQNGVTGVKVEVILHPSPASPAANKGWEAVVEKQLTEIGVDKYLS